jgi:hypothetical protein
VGVSSTAMAGKGGGGGHGMMGHHFNHHFPNFRNRFLRNQAFFPWGWGDWGWGPYGEGGNTTVVNFPSAIPGAEVTGSTSPPCRLQAETFTVPSSAGGTKPVEIVGCR